MFTQLHHTLSQGKGECVALSLEVQESLQAWQILVRNIVARPTHLCEMNPPPPIHGAGQPPPLAQA